MAGHFELRFYESVENLQRILSEKSSTAVTSDFARLVSTYLTQGRLYFDAAEKSDLVIRPLIIYYGLVGFAGAIALSRSLSSDFLQIRGHGLKHTMNQERVSGFSATVHKSPGTFHSLNDAIRGMEGSLTYTEQGWQIEKCPTAESSALSGQTLGLKEVLARIPGLGELFRLTFNETPGSVSCGGYHPINDGVFTLDVYPHQAAPNSIVDLQLLVSEMRARFPILDRFVLTRVQDLGSDTALTFVTFDRCGFDELQKATQEGASRNWHFPGVPQQHTIPQKELIVPMAGSLLTEPQSLVKPFSFGYVAELSLIYIAMFILSNIVRYRPYVWSHAITATATATKGSDDHMIAIVESFMSLSLRRIPQLTIAAITNRP